MPTCPICGSRHDSEGGVVQHIFMSRDSAHGGHNHKGDIYRMLDGGQVVDDVESDGGTDEETNPAMDGPTFTPIEDEPDDDPEEEEYSCPECGSDLYDLRGRDGRADFQCVDCEMRFEEE